MSRRFHLSRRGLLKLAAVSGTGLAVGYPLAWFLEQEEEPAGPARPDRWPTEPGPGAVWVRIGRDDRVTVVLPRCEMGQGAMTSLAMLVAEELEVDWEAVRTEWAPVTPEYGRQLTGASDSVRTFWLPLRQAGAAAREMLRSAAGHAWQVDPDGCRAELGRVWHPSGDRSLSYGELAEAAARLPVPLEIRLKAPAEFQVIGTPVPRLDIPSKVDGRAIYGWDVSVPGMVIAGIRHCPVEGGTLERFDAAPLDDIPGIRDVVCLEGRDGACTAIAVLADSFWTAERGLRALRTTWRPGPNATATSARLARSFARFAERSDRAIVERGTPRDEILRAGRRIDAVYETPYLAHATMEPINCTARVEAGRCDVWIPTQLPTRVQEVAAEVSGLPREAVTVHQTFLGGGFGRRQQIDMVAEAVQLARRAGVPIKLLWSREEDIAHGYYRPATYHQLSAALDDRGLPTALLHRIVGIGLSDTILVQGIDEVPYQIAHRRVSLVRQSRGPVNTGPWRGLARSQNTFVTECFLDEIARAGRRDPLALRRELLSRAPRHRAVLELAASKAGWNRPLPAGRYHGLALGENFGGICAQVAEVSLAAGGGVRVHRVVCALDCGRMVNPDTVVAQMEGGIVFGLSAALKEAITIADGRVEQHNFNDYPVLRMSEVPAIEVYLIDSADDPGGVGETSVPPIAPAVANAVSGATGVPVRRLPIGSGGRVRESRS